MNTKTKRTILHLIAAAASTGLAAFFTAIGTGANWKVAASAGGAAAALAAGNAVKAFLSDPNAVKANDGQSDVMPN